MREDLFEAIIGAVALDSKYDLEVLEKLVKTMLDPEFYLDNTMTSAINYVNIVHEWSLKENGKLPEYSYTLYPEGWFCSFTLNIDGVIKKFCGFRKSKTKARMEACENALGYFNQKDVIAKMKDEIKTPSREFAINQLQELAQKRYIMMPEYEFIECYANDIDDEWECMCFVEGEDVSFSGYGNSKKRSKEKCSMGNVRIYP